MAKNQLCQSLSNGNVTVAMPGVLRYFNYLIVYDKLNSSAVQHGMRMCICTVTYGSSSNIIIDVIVAVIGLHAG